MSTIRKIRKLVKTPGLYFRDMLLKRYPIILSSYKISSNDIAVADKYENSLLNVIDVKDDVDVVFTWVDGKDPRWREKKEKYLTDGSAGAFLADGYCRSRFDDHNEIYYSVLSVQKFLPWVRNIYIITDEQKPSLRNYDKVIIVDHKEILPPEVLPTFNSHVIETSLHKIPGLSNFFIYFNDDFFVAKPLPKTHFFRSNGLVSIYKTTRNLYDQKERGYVTPTLLASLNGCQLLARDLGKAPDCQIAHTYVPLRKDLFSECYDRFEVEISRCQKNKFRSETDLNLPTFLVPWYTYLKGFAFENVDLCYYCNIHNASSVKVLSELKKTFGTFAAPDSFCVNDVAEGEQLVDNSEFFAKIMRAMFAGS